MKKNKLSLKSFKVQSFVTSVENGVTNTLKGGTGETQGPQICGDSIDFCSTLVQCGSGPNPVCNQTDVGCPTGLPCQTDELGCNPIFTNTCP